MLIEVDKVYKWKITSFIMKSYTPIHTLNNEVLEKKNYNSNIYRDLKLWITLLFTFILNFNWMNAQHTFLQEQLNFDRVKQAYEEKYNTLQKEFETKNLSFPPKEIYIRSFKSELDLEIWVKEDEQYELFKVYDVCQKSGDLGPKLKQGDYQVPEGFYYIDRFNPMSSFHLSLGINYPNEVDKIRSAQENPGGDIFIHGDCVTIGCLPMTDDLIKEIYLLAVLAKSNNHIYPYRFSYLKNTLYRSFGNYLLFWNNLEEEYNYFENNKALRNVSSSAAGKYIFYK